MTNKTTGKPLLVITNRDVGPHLRVPESQLEELISRLDQSGFSYEVDDDSYSVDGNPYVTFISFARGTDPAAVQRVLDSLG